MNNCEITSKKNKIIVQGYINKENINQSNPNLFISTVKGLKTISCKYEKQDDKNQLYKLICNPISSFKANLHESIGRINDNQNIILSFNKTSDYFDYTAKENSFIIQ